MSTRSEAAVAAVEEFFAQHKKRSVIGMAELCAPRAAFESVPFVAHDKQRVIRGVGYVNGVGRTVWGLGFRAFPDLTNKVTDIFADDNGNVVAEVTISGTQASSYLTVASRGQKFTEKQVFRFGTDKTGKIVSVVNYYDAGGMNTQLGHTELD
jgi:predicted ester cyclase